MFKNSLKAQSSLLNAKIKEKNEEKIKKKENITLNLALVKCWAKTNMSIMSYYE